MPFATRHPTPRRRPEDADELCRLAEQQQRQQRQPTQRGLTRYQLFVRLVGNIYSPERQMPRALRGWVAQVRDRITFAPQYAVAPLLSIRPWRKRSVRMVSTHRMRRAHSDRGPVSQMALIFAAVTLLGAAFLVLLLYKPSVKGLPPAPPTVENASAQSEYAW